MGHSAYSADDILALWMGCEVAACVAPWVEVKLGLCGIWFDFLEREDQSGEVAGVRSRQLSASG